MADILKWMDSPVSQEEMDWRFLRIGRKMAYQAFQREFFFVTWIYRPYTPFYQKGSLIEY